MDLPAFSGLHKKRNFLCLYTDIMSRDSINIFNAEIKDKHFNSIFINT